MKNLKRVLALVTVFAMVMSVSAFAINVDYEHADSNRYNDDADGLANAVDSITDETGAGTITLEADITGVNDIWVEDNQNVTIDLAGHDITSTGGDTFSSMDNATLTITDSVGEGDINGNLWVQEDGTLNLNSADLNGSIWASDGNVNITNNAVVNGNVGLMNGAEGTIVNSTVNGNGWGVGAWSGVSLDVDNSTINADYFAIFNNGTITNDPTTININNSNITTTEEGEQAIYHPGPGTMTISGDTNITGGTGVEIRNGTLNVTGGTITATYQPTGEEFNNNGSTTSGAGIGIATYGGDRNITVNITGGEINGYTALYESNPNSVSDEDLARINVNITDGEFNSTLGGEYAVNLKDSQVGTNITGGIYNTDVTTYLADGYIQLTSETAVGNLVAGQVVTSAQRQAEIDRLAAEEAARIAAEEAAEAARRAAEAASYDDSSDDDTPATPATETIEEEATPLAALPEELAEISTAADVVDTAVELGIIEEDSYVATEAAAAETVVNAVAVIAGDDFGAEEVAAIAEEVGVSFEGEVTRNDLVVVLFTLAEKQGYDVSARASLDAFTDADKASEAMAWAVEVGLINGKGDGILDPTGTLTQEQLLIIIARFMALTK